jgi:hypothetical protein
VGKSGQPSKYCGLSDSPGGLTILAAIRRSSSRVNRAHGHAPGRGPRHLDGEAAAHAFKSTRYFFASPSSFLNSLKAFGEFDQHFENPVDKSKIQVCWRSNARYAERRWVE